MAGVRRAKGSGERIVTGVAELDRRLKLLDKKIANKAARAGLLKGVRLAAKEIKKSIPSRLKSVRAAIGHRVDKKTKQGTTQAKAGAAVGKRKATAKRPKRSTKHGVGIGKENIHWWILGTKERQTKTGRRTGRMPAHPVIKQLGLTSILAAVEEGSTKTLNKELAKLKTK